MNSTIHAVVIVIGMLTTAIRQQWDDHLLPLGSTTAATALFSLCTLCCLLYCCCSTCGWRNLLAQSYVALGYFLFDLYVLVRYRVPLWRVFVIHHIVAAYVLSSLSSWPHILQPPIH